MWPVIGAVAVIFLLIAAVIVYARKQGVSSEKIKQIDEGARALERETEMVNRWTGRNLLRALQRTAGRLQNRIKRDAGTLHDDE